MRESLRACRRLPAALFAPPARTGSARQHGPRACRRLPAALFALLFLGAGAGRASADLTVFAGRTSTPAAPATRGAALGISLQPAGVEFEYAGTPADQAAGSPALRTGLFNLILGAPWRGGGRFRIYGSVGGGLYRQRLDTHARVGLAASAGGGVNVSLAEPLRVRLDYRVLALRGAARHRRPRRVYVGLNVAF